MIRKFKEFEEAELKRSNGIILADEGIPRLLVNMEKEFVEMLSGALIVKAPAWYAPKDSKSARAYDQKIPAFNEEGEEINITLRDFLVKKVKQ